MKKLLFLFLLIAGIVDAQVIDQSNLGGNSSYEIVDSGVVIRQSFIAGVSGQLSSVDLDAEVFACPSGITNLWVACYVYDSSATNVIANQTAGIPVPFNRGLFSIGFVAPATLQAGSLYYLEIFASQQICDSITSANATINWYSANDDSTYTFGTADINGSPLNKDMYFQTHVTPGCANPISAFPFVVSGETGCAGNNAEASVNPTGGDGFYTYSWAPAGGTGQSTGQVLTQGMYTVTVSDTSGCTAQGNVFISGSTLTLNATSNAITCYAGGTINSYASGGDGTLTYLWSNGATTADLTNVTIGGQYYVTVSDTAGCIKSDTTILTDSRMNITFDLYPSTCGNNNAYMHSYANGSSSPTYSWNGPSGFTSSNQSIFNLVPGVYTLMVTDTVCPTDIDSIIVSPSTAITISHTINNHVSCNGGYDGSATIAITGAGPSPNIWWTYGASGLTATNLPAGYTFVQVMDSSGLCYGTDSILITEPSILMDSLSFTEPSCGASNGSVITNVTGGTGPYSYFWSTGNMASNLTGVEAGIYMVDITDANGCPISDIATLGTSGGPTVTPTVTDISCYNADNGAISVAISGGTPPYTVYWTDMDSSYTTLSRTNLQAGPYELFISDVNGCQTILSADITEPFPIYASMNATSPSSCLALDGSITTNVQGGTAPYTYLWSDASTASTLNGLAAGVYSLTVTDANGCSGTNTEFLSDPTLVDAFGNDIPTNCGTNTGSIDITAINGSGSYSYQWTNGATTEDISGLYPGDYGVTITDLFDGCVKALEFSVNSSTANYEPEVCMVTVDSLDEKNVVIWERPTIGGIKEFVIYRETSEAGMYRYIGTTSIDSLTQMKDTLANTDLHGWKYKISAIDSCGVETGVSEVEHRPAFLTVDTNGVGLPSLVWTNYIGRPITDYIVKRNANNTGWVDVATVPASQNAYVDMNCPSGYIEYTIEVVFATTCEATRGAINTSRSNIRSPSSLIVGIKKDVVLNQISLYPNPSAADFTVSLSNKTKENTIIEVVNSLGQIIYTNEIAKGAKTQTISAESWMTGIYFVRINNSEIHTTIKFVKQ